MNSIEKEYEIFLQNIAWLRNNYEFSKEKMAKIMSISVDMLDQIEQGILPDDLTVESILKIGKYFKIKPKDLLSIRLNEKNC